MNNEAPQENAKRVPRSKATLPEAEAPQRVSDVIGAVAATEADVIPAPEVLTMSAPDAVPTMNVPGEIEAGAAGDVDGDGDVDLGTRSISLDTSLSLDRSVSFDTGEILVAEMEPESGTDLAVIGETLLDGELVDEVPSGPSRRDMLKGEPFAHPEPVSMLTAERILEKSKKREAPSSGWNRFLYNVTFHIVNRGDSPAVRHRKAIEQSISRRLEGTTRFVPVLTRKGGVGKTTVTTMIGMALASIREDRIIAIDANPDRGTLAERFTRNTEKTVRDLVSKANTISSFSDFSTFVTRDKTRLDVLASDTDPFLSEAFDENDYNVVADLVSRYYTIALTDCGTGIVHSVMSATLKRADSLVIVSGGSFDEARLAAETLTWLDTNGYADLVRNSIVAINTATQGTNLVKIHEIEAHFQSRVRDIVRIPYDPLLATGSVIDFEKLLPATQHAARTLAALVVEGLPVR